MLDRAFDKLKLKAPLYKAILDALSERDETAEIVLDSKGRPVADSELRDNENVPLSEKIDAYMQREVLPFVPDAWVDEEKTKVGYEISFNRYFYVYQAPRSVEEIQSDLTKIEDEIAALLKSGAAK
jgi:type I restriction enzyme M protein